MVINDSNIDDTKFLMEPQIHSHITDCLDEDHPLAYKRVYCKNCCCLLHRSNRCQQTWIETGKGNYCFDCFVSPSDPKEKIHKILDDEYGLTIGSKEEENFNNE